MLSAASIMTPDSGVWIVAAAGRPQYTGTSLSAYTIPFLSYQDSLLPSIASNRYQEKQIFDTSPWSYSIVGAVELLPADCLIFYF